MQLPSNCEVKLLDHMSSDDKVAKIARVSFDQDEWEVIKAGAEAEAAALSISDRDRGLIRYLAFHLHKSPFFHPKAQFRITMPVVLARQWMTHQIGIEYNEVSRRYVDSAPEFYMPAQWNSRPEKSKKQGSGEALNDYKQILVNNWVEQHITDSAELYSQMLEAGVAPEQARFVLPQTMLTSFIMTGSLYAFSNLCALRLDGHAQSDIRPFAQAINDEMAQLFPVSWHYLTIVNDKIMQALKELQTDKSL